MLHCFGPGVWAWQKPRLPLGCLPCSQAWASLWASQSPKLILLTRFWQGSQDTCIHMSRSSMMCHFGGKTLALAVKYLCGAQISMFALRDWADPACYHFRCDKCLCKLNDSHTYILQRSRDSGLSGGSNLAEAGLGFGGYSSSEHDIFS